MRLQTSCSAQWTVAAALGERASSRRPCSYALVIEGISWASQACERERGCMNADGARLLVEVIPGGVVGLFGEVKMVFAESHAMGEVNVK